MNEKDEPLSVYIHVPFCKSKCPYCSFNSFLPKAGEIEAYLGGIEKELGLYVRNIGSSIRAKTIYIGGGTPSVLTLDQWDRLFACLEKNLYMQKDLEFTVEANPESLTEDQLSLWKDRSVNRVSLGIQSLDDGELKWLSRLHDSYMAEKALDVSLERGFNVSADFMFGLKGQTLKKWRDTLKSALKLGLGHISVYQLTLDEGSWWGKNPPEGLPDGYGHYRFAQWYLPKKGLEQYEIASFAKKGLSSRHNMSYWKRDLVLGLGPGAWGFLEGLRYSNIKDLSCYLKSLDLGVLPVAYKERLRGMAMASEAAILALRTKDGIDLDFFERRFGEKASLSLQQETKAFPRDCLCVEGKNLRLSKKGMRVANSLWERLLWE